MGRTIVQKVIEAHLVGGSMTPGSEIALRIDQTLTQDAAGTMAYLELESIAGKRVDQVCIGSCTNSSLQDMLRAALEDEISAPLPLYLGVKAVVAKSFARIHAANLINAGILPLCFENPEDYDRLSPNDELAIVGIYEGMDSGRLFYTT